MFTLSVTPTKTLRPGRVGEGCGEEDKGNRDDFNQALKLRQETPFHSVTLGPNIESPDGPSRPEEFGHYNPIRTLPP